MVNVSDIKIDEIPTPTPEMDMLDLMFKRQHELAIKYLPIEEANGLLQTPDIPVNIDDKKGQARLKDYAWRVQEELYEATDALIQHPDNREHFLEEMIDSIHFFIELNILCGISPKEIRTYYEIPENMDSFTYLENTAKALPDVENLDFKYIPDALLIYSYIGQPVGNAMNRLKNKPWKQTHMVTDKQAFMDCIMPTWIGYFKVLSKKHGLTAKDIFTLYFKKSEVNKFRIKSHY